MTPPRAFSTAGIESDETFRGWADPRIGIRSDELFKSLYDEYNTVAVPLQNPYAFHTDVRDAARRAKNNKEFHAFMAETAAIRRQQMRVALDGLTNCFGMAGWRAFDVIGPHGEGRSAFLNLLIHKSLDNMVLFLSRFYEQCARRIYWERVPMWSWEDEAERAERHKHPEPPADVDATDNIGSLYPPGDSDVEEGEDFVRHYSPSSDDIYQEDFTQSPDPFFDLDPTKVHLNLSDYDRDNLPPGVSIPFEIWTQVMPEKKIGLPDDMERWLPVDEDEEAGEDSAMPNGPRNDEAPDRKYPPSSMPNGKPRKPKPTPATPTSILKPTPSPTSPLADSRNKTEEKKVLRCPEVPSTNDDTAANNTPNKKRRRRVHFEDEEDSDEESPTPKRCKIETRDLDGRIADDYDPEQPTTVELGT